MVACKSDHHYRCLRYCCGIALVEYMMCCYRNRLRCIEKPRLVFLLYSHIGAIADRLARVLLKDFQKRDSHFRKTLKVD